MAESDEIVVPRVQLRLEAQLPQTLPIVDGRYATSATGEYISFRRTEKEEEAIPRVLASVSLDFEESIDDEQLLRQASRLSQQLLSRLNRFVRWCRVLCDSPWISELSLWQLSPFRVEVHGQMAGIRSLEPMVFSPPIAERSVILDERKQAELVRGLASGLEPEVADLFFRDAEYAATQGRFREAVLFAWATIDSQFNSVYDQLVAKRLAGDYAAGRRQLLGLDLGLRTKMTVVLNLLTGQSLFLQGADRQWNELAESYGRRNAIIHRGSTADQPDAEQAIRSAYWVIERVSAIAAEHGIGEPGDHEMGESE